MHRPDAAVGKGLRIEARRFFRADAVSGFFGLAAGEVSESEFANWIERNMVRIEE